MGTWAGYFPGAVNIKMDMNGLRPHKTETLTRQGRLLGCNLQKAETLTKLSMLFPGVGVWGRGFEARRRRGCFHTAHPVQGDGEGTFWNTTVTELLSKEREQPCHARGGAEWLGGGRSESPILRYNREGIRGERLKRD